MNLDMTDRKILYELDLNARSSHSKIGRKLRINRNIVAYRIKEMKRKEIIKGTFIEINNQLLGFYNVRLFIKFSNTKLEEIKRFVNSIKKDGRIMWLSSVLGKWDLDVVYMVRSIAEFNIIYENILDKNNNIIESTHMAILTKVSHYPKDYLINAKIKNRAHKNYVSIEETMDKNASVKINKIDTKMLQLLSFNADISVLEISRRLKISINTVKQHLKYLEKSKIIVGYTVFYDTEKLGLRYYKLHINLKNYTKESERTIESWIFTKNYAIYNNRYLNGENFEIELHLEKESELIEFQKELLSLYGNYIKEMFVIQFYNAEVFRCYPIEE